MMPVNIFMAQKLEVVSKKYVHLMHADLQQVKWNLDKMLDVMECFYYLEQRKPRGA